MADGRGSITKLTDSSRVDQEEILPLLQNPSAGTCIVTVYPEAPMREDMVGQVGDDGYRATFDAEAVPPVVRRP